MSSLFYEGCGSSSPPARKLKQIVPFPPETHVIVHNLAMLVFFGTGFIDDLSESKFPNSYNALFFTDYFFLFTDVYCHILSVCFFIPRNKRQELRLLLHRHLTKINGVLIETCKIFYHRSITGTGNEGMERSKKNIELTVGICGFQNWLLER